MLSALGKSDGQPPRIVIVWVIRRSLAGKLNVHLLQEFANPVGLDREAYKFFDILNEIVKKYVRICENTNKYK